MADIVSNSPRATLINYSYYLHRFLIFSEVHGLPAIGPASADTFVKFAVHICHELERPSGTLYQVKAALQLAASVLDIRFPSTMILSTTLRALVDRFTTRPRDTTPSFSVDTLVRSWLKDGPVWNKGSTELRDRTMMLIGLLTLSHSKDISGMMINMDRFFENWMVDREWTPPHLDLLLWDFKTDSDLTGEWLKVYPTNDALCPVRHMTEYLYRTRSKRQSTGLGFCFLKNNSTMPLKSTTVGARLAQELKSSLGGKWNSRSIRKTGRMRTLELGYSQELADKLGRWKTVTVSQRFYEDLILPEDFSKRFLLVQEPVDTDQSDDVLESILTAQLG